MYPVYKWEKCNTEDIPVTEPNKNPFKAEHDLDDHAIHVILNDNHLTSEASNIENCFKLMKKDFALSVMLDSDKSTKEKDLKSFLSHHIRLKSPSSSKKLQEYDFYFQRNETIYYFGEKDMFGSVSDDNNVLLIKFTGSKLKLCYFDLKTCTLRFELVSVSKRSDYNILLHKNTVWIYLKNDSRSEVIRLQFLDTEVSKSSLSLGAEFLPANYEFIDSYGVRNVSMSTHCLMFNSRPIYVEYNQDANDLSTNQIPTDVFANSECNYIIGDLCTILSRKDDDHPPKLKIVSLRQPFQLISVVDFTELSNYQDYCAFNFRLTIHPGVMKAVIKTGPNDLIIIDLLKYKITQILKCSDFFCHHLNELIPMFSLDGNEVRLLGTPFNTHHNMYLCANFSVWHGFTLKDASKQSVLKHFSDSDIEKMNLPNTLQQEFQNMVVHDK